MSWACPILWCMLEFFLRNTEKKWRKIFYIFSFPFVYTFNRSIVSDCFESIVTFLIRLYFLFIKNLYLLSILEKIYALIFDNKKKFFLNFRLTFKQNVLPYPEWKSKIVTRVSIHIVSKIPFLIQRILRPSQRNDNTWV